MIRAQYRFECVQVIYRIMNRLILVTVLFICIAINSAAVFRGIYKDPGKFTFNKISGFWRKPQSIRIKIYVHLQIIQVNVLWRNWIWYYRLAIKSRIPINAFVLAVRRIVWSLVIGKFNDLTLREHLSHYVFNGLFVFSSCGVIGAPEGCTVGDAKNASAIYPICCERDIVCNSLK